MPAIAADKYALADFRRSSSLEWLETNGIGGYASGTVSGAHSRRYHGLLVASLRPPLERAVLLSKFEETLVADGERFELSTNCYPGKIYPEGYKFITEFRLDPFPVWTYKVDGIEIEKKLFMVHGENTTILSWSIKKRQRDDKNIYLELRPLLAYRDHHYLRHADSEFNGNLNVQEGAVSFETDPASPTLFLANNSTSIERSGIWYRNFEYSIEKERGFDFTEDLFQPCVLRFDLIQTALVVASTEKGNTNDVVDLENSEIERRKNLVKVAGYRNAFAKQLVLAADQFIVDRGDGKTILAGYHWFSDWGRDTMIALPGLTLATKRPEIAKSILSEFAKHISEGMIPNRFPDAGETPEYNTVDATLWFFEAIRAYSAKTDDHEFIRRELYDKLVMVIDWHIRGSRFGIHVDTDGLLYSGEAGVQLTWMDAKIGDFVVTPRTGKAVEIQALWYNALRVMADLSIWLGEEKKAACFMEMAIIARESFNGQFWNDEAECLYDVIDSDMRDASIRPNQIFAVGLFHPILNGEKAAKVVAKVESELLTPLGLRSLSPQDPRYAPTYIGSPLDRDSVYHQGTVWAWLIGPFIDAYRRVHPDNHVTRRRVDEILAGFMTHLSEAMIGQVSEIFDGDAPHAPRGCAAQAWSVGELLRVLSGNGDH